MYIFRNYIADASKIELIVHTNSKGKLLGLDPFQYRGSKY